MLTPLNSHELHKLYLQLHDASRIYRDNVRNINSQRIKKGKTPRRAQTVEMDNFQNPQLSSVTPLVSVNLWLDEEVFNLIWICRTWSDSGKSNIYAVLEGF